MRYQNGINKDLLYNGQNMPRLQILGCGSSWGVPVASCKCDVCLSDSPFNKRNRSSLLISDEATNILVDCGFDIRHQLLKYDICKIDAAILTHDHADHVSGLDELRVFKILHGIVPDLYSDTGTLNVIMERFAYLFDSKLFTPKAIDFYSKLKINDIELQFFKQDHGVMDSLGFRIGDVVYSNDLIDYPQQSKQYLKNSRIWIMDCIDYKSTLTHCGLDRVMKWKQEFSPQKIYLTNLSHDLDYFELKSKLPSDIEPAYDGLVIEI